MGSLFVTDGKDQEEALGDPVNWVIRSDHYVQSAWK
jgi:hypothetical protein